MRVSIVMATYNGAQFIQEQLQSFVEQTKQPDELIIIDDCSSDETESIILNFAKTAPFKVEFYRNRENIGYSGNFNNGLIRANGELVFLADQDDCWLNQKIEVIYSLLYQNSNTYLIVHDIEFCDKNLNRLGHTKLERLEKFTNVNKYHVTGMATAVRKEFLQLCLPVPDRFLSHDTWLHMCAYYCGIKRILPDVLALYRRHEKNATASHFVNTPSKTSKFNLLVNKFYDVDVETIRLSILRHQLVRDWLLNNKDKLNFNIGVKKNLISKSYFKLQIKLFSLKIMLMIVTILNYYKKS